MEVACWLQVKAERRYAGVSHIDVDNTSAGEPVETIVPLLPETKDLWNKKIRSFLDAAITVGKAHVPTDEIIYNQALLDGIHRSSECGHEVEINIPES